MFFPSIEFPMYYKIIVNRKKYLHVQQMIFHEYKHEQQRPTAQPRLWHRDRCPRYEQKQLTTLKMHCVCKDTHQTTKLLLAYTGLSCTHLRCYAFLFRGKQCGLNDFRYNNLNNYSLDLTIVSSWKASNSDKWKLCLLSDEVWLRKWTHTHEMYI